MADRRIIDERSREVEFFKKLLPGFRKGDIIFDIGANQGHKTDIFLRLGARVVAVEPDEFNQEVLRQKFLKYRIFRRPVVVVAKAVSDRTAAETMWVNAPGSAKNTLSAKWVETLKVDQERFGSRLDFPEQKKVETVTLDDLIASHGIPSYVKIDVEGYEPSVLRGLHRRISYVSFEINLPEFKPEGKECVELLRRLDADGKFNYAADCQQGLALDDWLEEREFLRVLNACEEKSIEVFWRASSA